MMASRSLLMFPGQGAQRLGMCKSMVDCAEAKALFSRAEKVLGFDPLDICLLEGEKFHEMFKSTDFNQVMVFVTCMAKVENIRKRNPEALSNVSCVTGLSIGEITALVYAGALSFESALFLIKERGKAMNKIVSNFSSGICNIHGLPFTDLQIFLDKNFPSLEISTEYGDEIIAVAGSKTDLSMMEGILLQEFKEKQEKPRVVHCNVAGAFHTSYMAEAAKHVSTVLEDIEVLSPKIPVIMNATGKIEDNADDIKRLLGEQMAAPVKWKQSMITAHDSGVREFIEIAPSGYLCSMLKTIRVCSGCSTRLIAV